MKKTMKASKLIATSVLSIVMCGSLIAGATFALFTSESTTNLTISSGNVELVSKIGEATLYSATTKNEGDYEQIDESETSKLDNYSGTYYYKPITATTNGDKQTGTFLNEGTVEISSGSVTLSKITAGDFVEFPIEIENKSNVATQYRFKINYVSGAKLLSGMRISIGDYNNDTSAELGGVYVGLSDYVSPWYTWEDTQDQGIFKAVDGSEKVKTVNVKMGLPITADKQYMNLKDVNLNIVVEAVQGNASTTKTDEPEVTLLPEKAAIAEVTSSNAATEIANAVKNSDTPYIELEENVTVSSSLLTSAVTKDSTINLNGKTLTKTDNGSAFVADGKSVTIKDGTLEAKQMTHNSGDSVIQVSENSSLNLENAKIETNASALYARGQKANIVVENSEIIATTYAVGTNASNQGEYSGHTIILKNSTLRSISGCAVCVNVPTNNVLIEGCTIMGGTQGLLVRGGTVEVKDSNIQLYLSVQDMRNAGYTYEINSAYNLYAKRIMPLYSYQGGGNWVTSAAVVLGTQNSDTAYNYPTNLTLSGNVNIGSTVIDEYAEGGVKTYANKYTGIFMMGYYTTNCGEKYNAVTLNVIGNNVNVNGGNGIKYNDDTEYRTTTVRSTSTDDWKEGTTNEATLLKESPAIFIANRTMNDVNVVTVNGKINVSGAIYDAANETEKYTKNYADMALVQFTAAQDGTFTIAVPTISKEESEETTTTSGE